MKLKGSKIILRPPTPFDVEDIYKYAKDREISQYMMHLFPYPYKKADAEGFVKRVTRIWAEENRDEYVFVIEFIASQEVAGSIALKKIDNYNKNSELGYWVAKKYWRKGIASEAINLILDFGFNELGLERIYAGVFHPNEASQKLLEKNGFKKEGVLRRSARRGTKWFHRFVYGILKSEYKKEKDFARGYD